MSKVTQIVSGVSTSGIGTYAYAELNCGHSSECKVAPQLYRCGNCETFTYQIGQNCKHCGHRGYKTWDVVNNKPGVVDYRLPEYQLTVVGQHVNCDSCKTVQRVIEVVKEAQETGQFAYARAGANGYGRLNGLTHVYVKAPHYPRGVKLLATLDKSHVAKEFAKTLSALSPTER